MSLTTSAIPSIVSASCQPENEKSSADRLRGLWFPGNDPFF